MAIQARKNLYRGVNPHLNSELQTPDSENRKSLWHSFHISFIAQISNTLNEMLPMRYVAQIQLSLQARDEAIQIDFLDPEEDFVPSVVIYIQNMEQSRLEPIIRIELISPTSKPEQTGHKIYIARRLDLLKSGLSLVEIDFIHEQLPLFNNLSVYPGEAQSYPYTIILCDPRPSSEKGQIFLHGREADAPLPVIALPLADADVMMLDFDKIYQQTYWNGRWGRPMQIVDYTQLPDRFHTYSQADQIRIKTRMATIAEADARGDDLEQIEL